MEVIQGKHKDYEMTTLTKATVYISKELGDILEECYYTDFDYNTADFFSDKTFKEIIEEKEDYEELTEDDWKDIEDIVELLGKIDFVTVEISM